MPTKHELETINDELLTERQQLRGENNQLRNAFGEVAQQIGSLQAQLTNLSQVLAKPAPSADNFAQQIAPLVMKLGEVIETMERAGTRADAKMREMDAHTNSLEATIKQQQAKLAKFSSLLDTAHQQTIRLQDATAQGTESLIDVLMTRGWRVLVTIALTVVLTSIAATYAIKTIYAPDALTIEQSRNWEAFLETMTPEMQTRIIESAKARRRQLARENDPAQGSILPPAEAMPSQTPDAMPTPTPPSRRARH